MLFILLGIVLTTQFHIVQDLINNNPDLSNNINNLLSSKYLLAGIFIVGLVVLVLIYLLRDKIKRTKLYLKFQGIIHNFIEGIKTVKNMKKKSKFFFHTVFIWVMYFTMIYVTFLAFDFTSELSIFAGLTVFVMTAFGMVAPSPGGIGTWHFMAIETLILYGITNDVQNRAFAFAAHGSMTLLLIVSGVLSFILLPIFNKDEKTPTNL